MKRYIIVVLLLISHITVWAQPQPSVTHVKTPEAAAFDRSIETPVSLYSGIPSISIPLYTINIKGVSVPITLNYHAGGIRTDQEATWVGLGWSLDYGGTISRKVRGAPDEDYFVTGSPNSNIDHFNQLPMSSGNFTADLTLRMSYINDAKYNNNDFMPDEFYYSALGYSGKFMYSQNGNKFVTYPKEDIAIAAKNSAPGEYGGSTRLYTWSLKLPDGASADFGDGAFTAQKTNIKRPISSWQLKKIKNTMNDSITYSYDTLTYTTYPFSGVMGKQFYPFARSTDESFQMRESPLASYPKTINYDSQLKTITFPEGTIEFIKDDRSDIASKMLSKIIIKDKAGVIIKQITFNAGLFLGTANDVLDVSSPWLVDHIEYGQRYGRLRLDGLTISGKDGSSKKYVFDYYTTGQLPSKYTFSQDHWGFYNAKANTTVASFLPNIMPVTFGGGDRSVNPAVSNVFSLKSITYPEGGKTEFQYENNTASAQYAPRALLAMYQDPNIPEVTQSINVSSYSRSSFFPSPDSTDAQNSKYFKKRFTLSTNSYMATNYGFSLSTTYGISTLEQYTPLSADNVRITLERIDNGNRTLVYSFNTTADNPNPNSTWTRTGTFDSGLKLLPGTYEMVAKFQYANPVGSPAENQPYNFNLIARYRTLDMTKKMIYVGGLRIKNINYYNTTGNLIKRKAYQYVAPGDPQVPDLTSGRIVSLPNYYQNIFQYVNNTLPREAGAVKGYSISSNSIVPLETTSGSFAGYEYVDELDIDTIGNQNLKTSYRFSFNQPYFYNPMYSYMSMRAYEPQEWTNGKLLNKKIYKGNNVLRQEDYTYYDYSPNLAGANEEDYVQEINTDLISWQYLGTAVTTTTQSDFYDQGPSIEDPMLINTCVTFNYGAANGFYSPYYIGNVNTLQLTCNPMDIKVPYFKRYTGFDKPKSKMITSYENGHPLTQTENYFYEKTPQLYQQTKVQSFSSRGDTLETRTQYPLDSAAVNVYNHMLKRHMVNVPLVQSQYKNNVFLNSSSTNYKQWTDTAILAPVREFVKVGLTGTPVVKTAFLDYDNKGNILNAKRPGGAMVNVQWGYNQSVPVVQVVNGGTGSYLYEGFEEVPGNSTRDDSRTGHYSSISGYSKTLNGLASGAYILSYWKKVSNAWSLISTNVTVSTGSYAISLSGQVDDIRFHPATAQMTTYTYDPLIGLTSVSDVKREITFYEYDDLQRLVNIKDKDKNVVKNYTYHYYNETVAPSGPAPTLSLQKVYYNSIYMDYYTTDVSSTSCILQYTDLTTSQVYQRPLICNHIGTEIVPSLTVGRTYRFKVIQTLTAGGQISSGTVDVFVPPF